MFTFRLDRGADEIRKAPPRPGGLGFWTLGSTARLVMHECAVVRNNAVGGGGRV